MSEYNGESFMWAVEQMKKGRKVRRKVNSGWYAPPYTRNNQNWDFVDVTANDWEVFEEQKKQKDNPLADSEIQTYEKESYEYKSLDGKKKNKSNPLVDEDLLTVEHLNREISEEEEIRKAIDKTSEIKAIDTEGYIYCLLKELFGDKK